MAASHGKDAKVYANGYDITGYGKVAKAGGETDMADATTLADDDKVYIPGQNDGQFSFSGVFDTAGTALVDSIFKSAIGTATTVFEHLPAGDVAGSRGRACLGNESKYDIQSPVADIVTIDAEIQSAVGFEAIVVLQALTASLTGAGTTTGIDNAGSTTNGGAAYLQVTAINGGTAAIKVQHSADDNTYADLATFTNVTALGAERVAVTGQVNRYLRVVRAITGGTATAHVAFARK